MKNKLLAVAMLSAISINAQAYSIDGDINDWINVPSGSANDWNPAYPGVAYTVEDNDSYVWSRGKQRYDAEAMYVDSDADNIYVAVVTGRSFNKNYYPAGDLAFDFGNDGSFEYGVVVRSDSGNTDVNSANNGGIGNQGDVYSVTDWNVGIWDDSGNYVGVGNGTQAHPTTVQAGSIIGNTSLAYTELLYDGVSPAQLGANSGSHYLIEAKISKSLLNLMGLGDSFTVHWAMGCANDTISTTYDIGGDIVNVPEPSTLVVLLIGLSGFFFQGRKVRV